MTRDAPGPPPRTADRVRWSIAAQQLGDGRPFLSWQPARVLDTASVAKLFLLVEVAAQLVDGRLDPDHLLDRREAPAAADSGLWQLLRTPRLPVADLATLVAAVSDNWATNALLTLVTPARVARRVADLGVTDSGLDDYVRDERGAGDLARLSHGTAADWCRLMLALATGELVSPAVSRQLDDWLLASTDLSMAAAALGLDPLAHRDPDRGVTVRNKTGTDHGVRADVGVVAGTGVVAYACIANWDPGPGDPLRDEVLADMRTLGDLVARRARGDRGELPG